MSSLPTGTHEQDGTPRFASILGLGFGDCGKGLFTDFLCRHWAAHTVVRFNGGAQAGHNVVLPDGRHHTFSQFGSGSFVPGVRTILAHPVVVHPSALLVEAGYLERAGVPHALERLVVDSRCRINTPFHQAAGRLRELARRDSSHGTCGVGVGETVRHSLERSDLVLRYGDLERRATTLEKLDAIRRSLLDEFRPILHGVPPSEACSAEIAVLEDERVASRWTEIVASLVRMVPPARMDEISQRLHAPGTTLFEGAQGILLDEWRGFHPHTTWSSTHADAVDALAAELSLPDPVRHFGVVRSYMTRHGNGPFPTHDPDLDILAEPHNTSTGWQGDFRRGHPDAVLLRYALDAAGPLSGLLVGHLDVFDHLPDGLRWCEAYSQDPKDQRTIDRLSFSRTQDLSRQRSLCDLLYRSRPCYQDARLRSAKDLLDRVAGLSALPIRFRSHGNTHAHVQGGSGS